MVSVIARRRHVGQGGKPTLRLVANSPKSRKPLIFGLAPMDLQGEQCRNTGGK